MVDDNMEKNDEINKELDNDDEALTDPKLAMAGQLIDEAANMLQQALRLLGQISGGATATSIRPMKVIEHEDGEVRIIEGVFDGQRMIGPDGRHYSVPANYSSKSKLVEGDLLKLTITAKGAFIYKQVGPIPRRRLLAQLKRGTGSSEWVAVSNGNKYRVLTASVTYFKGKEDDEATVLVPESGQSTWAAVENIIKKNSDSKQNYFGSDAPLSDQYNVDSL